MRGKVTFVDSFSGDSLIIGDGDHRYEFHRPAGADRLRVGDRVEFTPDGDEARDVHSLDAAPATAGGWRPRGVRYDVLWAMFSFHGRLRRSHFWFSSVALFALWILVGGYFKLPYVFIPMLWPNLAVGVKRFHDMGRSGWLVAIPYVLIIALFVAIAVAVAIEPDKETPAAAGIIVALMFLTVLGFWIWLGVARSQRGSNVHGSNPKFPIDDTADAFS